MNTNPLTNPPFPTGATYDAPDWEERYRQLFERHESFMVRICGLLKLPYEVSSESDVLQAVEKVSLSVKEKSNGRKPKAKAKRRKKLA
jgi:hypothetical protein